MDGSGDGRSSPPHLLDGAKPINLPGQEDSGKELATEAFYSQHPQSCPPAINLSMAARVLSNAKDAISTLPKYQFTPLPSHPSGIFRLLLLSHESKAAEPQPPATKPFENLRSSARSKPKSGEHKLEVEPRPNPKQLMARLIPYQLGGSHPPYVALSWSWGDRNAPRSKSVRIWENGPQGKSKAKEIRITKNLEEALRQLREPK